MKPRMLLLAMLPVVVALKANAQAQATMKAQHDRLVASMQAAAPRPLPSGDTLLTWSERGVVLFHTARVTATSAESAMLRNDRMLGTARSTWDNGRFESAAGEWHVDDSLVLAWSVQRTVGWLTVRARRDTVVPIPDIAWWAVADFGMDDQLVPVLRALQPTGELVQLAVYRPYVARWDTVSVAARDSLGFRIVARYASGDIEEVLAIPLSGGGILATRRRNGHERRPLDGSPAFYLWWRHLGALQLLGASEP